MQSHSWLPQKDKIPRNKANHWGEKSHNENYKTLLKEIKQMENYFMLMDGKNQYRENGHTAQSAL